jgi:sulfopyruvate decarboxylase TPP-binding subunit
MKKIKNFYKKKISNTILANFINKNFINTYYVPDSIFSDLLNKISNKTLCTRENHAVSMSFGMNLLEKKSLVMMQNSGLGLSIDSLIGTFELFKEGCLIFVSNRGKLQWEEIQHKKWGKITRKFIKSLGFECYDFNLNGLDAVKKGYYSAFKKKKIVFVIFERGNLSE